MTLRRTPLKRTEFRRDSVRVSKPARRPRDTGPTAATRELVAVRANWCCEVCGRSLYVPDVGWTFPHSVHHRRPRAAGGSSRADTNSPVNLLLLCGDGVSGCHGWIEANRTRARDVGLLLLQSADPATTAVELHVGRVNLTDDGTYLEAS